MKVRLWRVGRCRFLSLFRRWGGVVFSRFPAAGVAPFSLAFPPLGWRRFLSLFGRWGGVILFSSLYTSLVFLTTPGEGRWGELSDSEEEEGEGEKEEDELEGKDGMGGHPPAFCLARCNQKLSRLGCSHCCYWTDATIFAWPVHSQTDDGDYTDAEMPSDREGEGESEEDEEAGRVVWEADEKIPGESDADEDESEPEPDEEEQAWFTPPGYKVRPSPRLWHAQYLCCGLLYCFCLFFCFLQLLYVLIL